MRAILIAARFIVGLVFIFSGTVKAIDPMGSAYKFQDYFLAFNLGFLKDMGLPLAILLCTAEFIAGFCVLTGIRQKAGITAVMLLMIIFTPLTFILALTNPVSDCGCFGDAIQLTNWQTFGKNVVLIILAAFLFVNKNKAINVIKPNAEWAFTAVMAMIFVLFALYNLRYLPVIDFLPYKTGVNIAENMAIPEGATPDKYETTFIYEKDGVKKEYDLNNYPADDTSWIFVDQRSVLLEKGYEPPIHDFTLTSHAGEDLTEEILSYDGMSLFMISKKLSEASKKRILKGFDLGTWCMNKGIRFYVLTASGPEEIKNYESGQQFCTVDETTLKTMVRTNPGYILLENGVIKGKWSWANVPEGEWFGSRKSEDSHSMVIQWSFNGHSIVKQLR